MFVYITFIIYVCVCIYRDHIHHMYFHIFHSKYVVDFEIFLCVLILPEYKFHWLQSILLHRLTANSSLLLGIWMVSRVS